MHMTHTPQPGTPGEWSEAAHCPPPPLGLVVRSYSLKYLFSGLFCPHSWMKELVGSSGHSPGLCLQSPSRGSSSGYKPVNHWPDTNSMVKQSRLQLFWALRVGLKQTGSRLVLQECQQPWGTRVPSCHVILLTGYSNPLLGALNACTIW